MAYLQIANITTTSFQARIAGLDTSYSRSDRYIEWELDGVGKGTTSIASYATASAYKSFTGLSPSTMYYVKGTIYWTDAGIWYNTFFDDFVNTLTPTPVVPPPTSVWFTNVSTSTIRFNWTNMMEATDGYDVYFKLTSDPSYTYIGRTYSTDSYFSGLSSGTSYSFGVRCVTSGGETSTIKYATQSTSSAPSRPSNWSWTTAELSAFNNRGAITTLTYLRWNDFVTKVNAFRTYKGLSTISASMSSGDRVMTAARFNTVNNAINAMSNTYITTRSTGQQVLGSYFITLSDALADIT